ncbi:IS3 family transposase [Veillonella atypica]|uniref:IS3 family transposase n=1 Tax=Veillonella atypica TaxID=39777 RepID=UPI003A5225B8
MRALKVEYSSFQDSSEAIEDYFNYYNKKIIQDKTKWMHPVKYRKTSICLIQ